MRPFSRLIKIRHFTAAVTVLCLAAALVLATTVYEYRAS